jgi:hypothetical protein
VKKLFPSTLLVLPAALLALTVFGAPPKTAAPAKPAPLRSAFAIPTSPQDGRDPFFPESTRIFQKAATNSNTRTVEISSLAVKGFYRDAKGALVIINNHTFAVGDEGDVAVPGGRVHVRCLGIRSNVVIIEVDGQKHELLFSGQ